MQAYALNQIVSSFGNDAVDVNFCPVADRKSVKKMVKIFSPRYSVGIIKNIIHSRKVQAFYRKNREAFDERARTIQAFKKHIPLTESCNQRNIAEICRDFDAYICGSDQIWNTVQPEYFLSFAADDKIKFSYAASFADRKSVKRNASQYKKYIALLDAVSLREKSNCDFLSELIGTECTPVIDPTLLLTVTEWDKVCSPLLCEQKYVFCYFLGNNKSHRNAAARYAAENGLKLITIPHLNGNTSSDVGFGDIPLYAAGPAEFISLIKNAEKVFTDSFHCCVFSILYHKRFCVFGRVNNGFSMNVRINDLLDLFGIAPGDYKYGEFIELDDTVIEEKLKKLREHSVGYIKEKLNHGGC